MPKTTSVAEERQPGEAPEVPPLARITRGSSRGWPLEFVSSGSKGQLSQLEPQAVGVTYWFDAAESGEPYDVVVRFTGTRLDVKGMPASTDHFQCRATLEGVEPGSGRMSMTHRITEVTGGRWKVTAEAVRITPDGEKRRTVSLPKGQAIGCSTYAPIALVRAPGVVLGSWPAFVGAGVVAALALQATLVRDHGLASGRILGLASVASVLGLLGAKAYYRLTHRHEDVSILAAGLSVQGFVIVSVATFVVGGAALGLPLGHLLDTTVPALLLGQAIGRLGCFFAGCCSGRPTHSWFGLWSSDRTVGTRRIPTQLMESAMAGTLALATGLIALAGRGGDGLLFAGGFAAYVVGRQILFPLRGLPRATRHGRQITLVAATVVLAGSVMVSLLR